MVLASCVDSAAQIILAPCRRPHTISATSRPALGDRELVETPPKTRLLPARHVVCALLPAKKHSRSFYLSRRQPSPVGYSVTGPLILVPRYIRHGALPSEFLLSLHTPFALKHSFLLYRATPAHCLAVVHWSNPPSRPLLNPPTPRPSTLVAQTVPFLTFHQLLLLPATPCARRYSAAADTLAHSLCTF